MAKAVRGITHTKTSRSLTRRLTQTPLQRAPATRLHVSRWLDVNEHVRDTRVALLDCAFYSMRNLVAFMHGNTAVHANVEIDIKIQPHLASPALLNFDNARN